MPKRSSGREGRMLWRDEAQEGIGAPDPSGSGMAERARSEIEALKSTASARSPGNEAIRREQRQEGRSPREGARAERGEGLEG